MYISIFQSSTYKSFKHILLCINLGSHGEWKWEQDTSSTPHPNASQSEVQQISNPKKPLLKFVNKITKNKKKNGGGCEEWMCTLCNHVFQGTYTRVWHHLLSLLGDGVKGCHVGLKEGWRWPSFIWFFH